MSFTDAELNRGHAEAITTPTDSAHDSTAGIDGAIIRIHPGRTI